MSYSSHKREYSYTHQLVLAVLYQAMTVLYSALGRNLFDAEEELLFSQERMLSYTLTSAGCTLLSTIAVVVVAVLILVVVVEH